MSTNSATESEGDEKSKKTAAGACLMSRMEINDNKAGMEGLDKEKINQIIYEASKGSKFYENERKKEEQLDQKIKKLKLYASQISPQKLQQGKVQADLLLEKMKFEMDLSHTIIHVDMDAFYAAVEMRDDPSLRSKPMAVGGMGMLSTSNYMARKFGVRAAMPGFIGLKLCPDLIIVKPSFDKYTSVSHEIRKILGLYDPKFCPMSLDEAYLDFGKHLVYRNTSLVSERTFILRNMNASRCEETAEDTLNGAEDTCACDLNDTLRTTILNSEIFLALTSDEKQFQSYAETFVPESANQDLFIICKACKKYYPKYKLKVYGKSTEDAVLEMRNRIEQRTYLTASAGIAPNMMLAKICSDRNKPNGQFRIWANIEQIENFIHDLPIRKVSGIGKVTDKLLGGLDVVKCSDIYHQRALLYHLFSSNSFHHFLTISLGIGSTTVERDEERKSISTEQTFHETSDVALLSGKCDEMSLAVAADLKGENLKGKTVTLKLKTVSFEVRQRSQTLQFFTNDESIISDSAKKLFLAEVQSSQPSPLKLRLMGVRVSKLVQNSAPAHVNNMFSKYKQKGVAEYESKKSNHYFENDSLAIDGIYCHNSNRSDDPVVEEEEDFSCPVDDHPDRLFHHPNQKYECQDGRIEAAAKINDKKKKNEAYSANILDFFARQKEGQTRQRDGQENDNCKNVSFTNTPSTSQSKSALTREDVDIDFCKGNDERRGCQNAVTNEASSLSLSLSQNPVENLHPRTSYGCGVGKLTCPICGIGRPQWDLQGLNSHIDACLNHQAIRDILHREKPEPQQTQSKRLRPDDKAQEEKDSGKVRKIQSSVLSYFRP